MGTRSRLAAAATAITAACALAPAAQAATVTCGQVVTASIRVDNNLTNCTGHGLIVGNPNITIDLYYKTIDGVNNLGTVGVFNPNGHDNVTIRRGTIRQFDDGVAAGNQAGGSLENLVLRENSGAGAALFGSDTMWLRSLQATNNAHDGVAFLNGSDQNVVHGGTFSDNGFSGIVVLGNSANNRLDDFDADDNTLSGVYLLNSSGTVVDFADMRRNGWDGLTLNNADGTTVTRIDADENSLDGIGSESGTSGSTYRDNQADDNAGRGISVEGPGNTITDNEANDNGGLGIFAVAGNTDGGGNQASGNGNPAQCTGVVCS